MVIQEVVLKLALFDSLHDLADDTKQGDGRCMDGLNFESLLWIEMTYAVFHCLGKTLCE